MAFPEGLIWFLIYVAPLPKLRSPQGPEFISVPNRGAISALTHLTHLTGLDDRPMRAGPGDAEFSNLFRILRTYLANSRCAVVSQVQLLVSWVKDKRAEGPLRNLLLMVSRLLSCCAFVW